MTDQKLPDDLPKLAPKQDAWLKHYLKCGNRSEAYRHAYACKNMSANAIQVEGSRLFNNPKITLWLHYYQKQEQAEFNIELESILKTMASVISRGLKPKQDKYNLNLPTDLGAVVRACAEVCRIKGYYAPVDTNIKLDTPLTAIQINTSDPIEAAKVYEKLIKGH